MAQETRAKGNISKAVIKDKANGLDQLESWYADENIENDILRALNDAELVKGFYWSDLPDEFSIKLLTKITASYLKKRDSLKNPEASSRARASRAINKKTNTNN